MLAAILCAAILTLLPSVLTGRIIDDGLIAKNLRALVLMFRENWMLALVGIAVVPLFVIPTRSAGSCSSSCSAWSSGNTSAMNPSTRK